MFCEGAIQQIARSGSPLVELWGDLSDFLSPNWFLEREGEARRTSPALGSSQFSHLPPRGTSVGLAPRPTGCLRKHTHVYSAGFEVGVTVIFTSIFFLLVKEGMRSWCWPVFPPYQFL